MKRCCSSDIHVPGQQIVNVYMFKDEVEGQREDLVVFNTDQALYVVFMSRNKVTKEVLTEAVKNIILINKTLVVLTATNKSMGFRCQYQYSAITKIG